MSSNTRYRATFPAVKPTPDPYFHFMRSTSFFLAALLAGSAFAQSAPSDSLFNTDQVVTIDLTFAETDFWSTLTADYLADLGATVTADVTITDNTGTHTYPQVEVDLKGNSSYSHPGNKKSFKIDFNDNISGQKYHGMTKMHFNNCFKDPTFMREKIFFDYARSQGVLAPRVLYANVNMNGTFWGFYDMVEAVDKNFLDRWVDDNDGNLFKAGDNFNSGGTTAADLAYYGNDPTSYYDRYELKTNESENDWSDLIALVQMLNTASDADLTAQFPAQWEWQPLLRSLAMDNLFANLDSYINSARNYYVYHDSTTLKWNWIKWDGNEAFGSYSAGMGSGNPENLAPDYVTASRPLMTKLMGVPALYTDYVEAYCTVLEGFTSLDMDPKIDAIKTLIQPHVTADVNKQYTTAQFLANIDNNINVGGGGGGGTVYGLKSFIAARANYLSGALDCSMVSVQELTSPVELSVYPNPVTDVLHVRLPVGYSAESLSLTDALGRSIPVNYSDGVVDLSGVARGAYVLMLRGSTGQLAARVVKN